MLEEDKADRDKLKIWLRLSKDLVDYKVNNIHKKFGLQLDVNAGDIIYYHKSDDPMGTSVDAKDVSVGIRLLVI